MLIMSLHAFNLLLAGIFAAGRSSVSGYVHKNLTACFCYWQLGISLSKSRKLVIKLDFLYNLIVIKPV